MYPDFPTSGLPADIHASMTSRVLLVPTLLLLAGACAAPPKVQQRAPEWDAFVQEFLDSSYAADPAFAVTLGRHEYDGRLADFSDAGIRHQIARLHAARDKALGFDSARLDSAQRFDREYLVSVIDGQLFWTERAEWPWKNPQYYATPLDPQAYVTRDYAPLDQRLKAVTGWARAVPAAVRQIRRNLRTPMPPTFADIGRIQFGGLEDFLEKDIPAVFASVTDPALQADFKAARLTALKSLKEMDTWFAAERKRAKGSFAMGPALFAEMLHATERVDVPLDQLERIARQDLQRNLGALRAACSTYAPRKTLKQCVDQENRHKPQGDLGVAAAAQLPMLEKFIREHDVAGIPDSEPVQVRESPPYMRWNFAFLNSRGLFEKNVASIYYVSPPDPAWPPKERAEYLPGIAPLLFTSAHEVWPGHFLHFLHINHVASPVGRIYQTYAYTEGWAHYAEEMMYDAGLGDDVPQTHIGQLTEALLRNVRFVSAIGLHTRDMTVAESERMFLDKGFQDAGNARQQAARGTFDPAYLNYTLGKLMIRKLRDDWTATRGGKAAWKQFHDAFLSFGGPPIPLVRKAMLGSSSGAL
jgi:hypothetical protein